MPCIVANTVFAKYVTVFIVVMVDSQFLGESLPYKADVITHPFQTRLTAVEAH